MTPYYEDGRVRLLPGDVRAALRSLETASVHCCATSPPYWALRSYLPSDHPDKGLELGSERTLEEFVANLIEVFREVRRVLRPDGTLWCNIADSFYGAGGANHNSQRWTSYGLLKPKDLCLIPERLAMALQADGWWVRSRICWAKVAPMPESVLDRPTSAWEYVWLLAPSARYYYDPDAVREPYAEASADRYRSEMQGVTPGARRPGGDLGRREEGKGMREPNPLGRQMRDFWLLGPEHTNLPHYATFPSEVPRRAILAGTSERGVCPACGAPWKRVVAQHGWQPTCQCNAGDAVPATVLDPFVGSGTTMVVAKQLGRKGIGIDLNPEYLELAADRMRQLAMLELRT